MKSKVIILLAIVIVSVIGCKKSVPVESIQKQPVFIRVLNVETNTYSSVTIIKL